MRVGQESLLKSRKRRRALRADSQKKPAKTAQAMKTAIRAGRSCTDAVKAPTAALTAPSTHAPRKVVLTTRLLITCALRCFLSFGMCRNVDERERSAMVEGTPLHRQLRDSLYAA